MIVGIGTDMCDVRRIARTLARFGKRFEHRVFTETERRRADRGDRAAALARRWAAKEACSKALGSGVRMGVNWREMSVSNLSTGQPIMSLSGGAARRLASLVPDRHMPRIHLSLTDERNYAVATVLIEALPRSADQ